MWNVSHKSVSPLDKVGNRINMKVISLLALIVGLASAELGGEAKTLTAVAARDLKMR